MSTLFEADETSEDGRAFDIGCVAHDTKAIFFTFDFRHGFFWADDAICSYGILCRVIEAGLVPKLYKNLAVYVQSFRQPALATDNPSNSAQLRLAVDPR